MTDRSSVHVVMLVRNSYTNDSRVEKEAATLHDHGYRVTIVADAATGLPEREDRAGVIVRRVTRPPVRVPGLRFGLHERRLAQLLTALEPAILHAHDSNALLPVGLVGQRLGAPFVYDAHELWLHRPRRGHHPLYHEVSRAYYAAIQRWLVPRAAAVLTVSPPIQRHLARVYRSAVDLVPNYPVATTHPQPGPLRDRLGDAAPADAPLVLHLGGLMATRGLDELVTAMLDVPAAHLVFLGDDDDARLRLLSRSVGVSERMHILAAVPSAEVESHAAAADVGVVTTLPIGLNNRYSLPNKLFQYMAAGIPVVASDFPQIREIVVGSGAGIVVDTEQPEAIAAAINRLLADPEAAREMGRRGRVAVEERYNWAVAARTLLAAYDRVVARTIRP